MPTRATLLTVGTYTADIILHSIPHIAAPGRVLFLEEPPSLEPGGHAVNVSIDYSQLGAPGPTASAGAVGRDWFAGFLAEAQRRVGVEPLLEEHPRAGTARNVIIVVRGEDRRFHVYRGANKMLTPEHVERVIQDYSPRLLYIAVGHSPHVDARLGDLLGITGGDTIVYADPAYTEEESVRALQATLERADFIHVNEAELLMLTHAEAPEEALRRLAGKTRGILLVTSTRGVTALLEKGDQLLEIPGFRVEAVDPTGAGDAFAAGLLWRLALRGARPESVEELAEDLVYAQAAGAAAVSSAGATRGVVEGRVEELVRSQAERVWAGVRVKRL